MGYREQWTQSLNRPAGKGKLDKNGKLVPDAPVEITGLVPSRIFGNMESYWDRGRGFTMKPEEIEEMFDNLMAPHKATPEELAEEKEKAEATKNMNWREKKAYLEKRKKNKKPRPPAPVSEDAIRKFDEGIRTYKKILNDDLLHLEKKYGSLLTQMHPEDLLPQMNDDDFMAEMASNQDTVQMALYGKQYFDPGNKEDQHFLEMQQYYAGAGNIYNAYKGLSSGGISMSKQNIASIMEEQGTEALELEDKINGPHMNKEEHKRYLEERKKLPIGKKGAFGRFK